MRVGTIDDPAGRCVDPRRWRRGCRRKCRRLYAKKRRLVRACHQAIVTEWEKRYEHVLYPKMPFKRFVLKDGSRWSRQARRDAHDAAPMALFRHARHRARMNEHFNVHVVSEVDTTRTCSRCGHADNWVLWSDHVFVCARCRFSTDRDVNAAKNILVSELLRPDQGAAGVGAG